MAAKRVERYMVDEVTIYDGKNIKYDALRLTAMIMAQSYILGKRVYSRYANLR